MIRISLPSGGDGQVDALAFAPVFAEAVKIAWFRGKASLAGQPPAQPRDGLLVGLHETLPGQLDIAQFVEGQHRDDVVLLAEIDEGNGRHAGLHQRDVAHGARRPLVAVLEGLQVGDSGQQVERRLHRVVDGLRRFQKLFQHRLDVARARTERRGVGAEGNIDIRVFPRHAAIRFGEKVRRAFQLGQVVIAGQQVVHPVDRIQAHVAVQVLEGFLVIEHKEGVFERLACGFLAIFDQCLGVQQGIGAALQDR